MFDDGNHLLTKTVIEMHTYVYRELNLNRTKRLSMDEIRHEYLENRKETV